MGRVFFSHMIPEVSLPNGHSEQTVCPECDAAQPLGHNWHECDPALSTYFPLSQELQTLSTCAAFLLLNLPASNNTMASNKETKTKNEVNVLFVKSTPQQKNFK